LVLPAGLGDADGVGAAAADVADAAVSPVDPPQALPAPRTAARTITLMNFRMMRDRIRPDPGTGPIARCL
jgi:hypothetical protein